MPNPQQKDLKSKDMSSLFHISLPCADIEKTTNFYINILGCEMGRNAQHWVDINLFGHQVTFTEVGKFSFENPNYVFEGKVLPSFHLGVIVNLDVWNTLYGKLSDEDCEIVHQKRFLNAKKGEHLSFFVKDPDRYMLEFKSFKNNNEIFEK
ncbi:MAG: VOC family protein [Flavobacteriaceae bacterium]|nr:VOC family protein [Flavobacteriaceae bacterium]